MTGLAHEPLYYEPLSRHLTILVSNFNQLEVLRNPYLLPVAENCLTPDIVRLYWLQLLAQTLGVTS